MGKYKKMCYDSWRYWSNCREPVTVTYDPSGEQIRLYVKSGRTAYFYIDDHGFGEYLFNVKFSSMNEAVCGIDINKENNKMKNFNFDFGKVMDHQARISMYGIAVKNQSGTWVAYDSKSESMMDVDILNFEGVDALYKMPVALNQVSAGDVIIHNGRPCFVVSFEENGNSFHVIDIYGGEVKDILPAKSPFGFNFVTKIVSLFNFRGTADASNPFGNMLPFLLMKDGDNKDMLPLLMFANGGNMGAAAANPMLFALLMNDSNDQNDFFKMFAFSQMFNQPAVQNN